MMKPKVVKRKALSREHLGMQYLKILFDPNVA